MYAFFSSGVICAMISLLPITSSIGIALPATYTIGPDSSLSDSESIISTSAGGENTRENETR